MMKSLVLAALGLAMLFILDRAEGHPATPCSLTGIDIKGGNYTLFESQEGKQIKRLRYNCPEGMYPYPVFGRTCNQAGKWSTMKSPDGKTVERAICKEVRCPTPVDFEDGAYFPRQNVYRIGDTLQFECFEGYKLLNSANRTCLPNGKWSGETTICDDGSGDCPNPGQPIGSIKYGNQYRIEDKVRYECRKELSMFGSNERECLEGGMWSGSEPICRQCYTFDTAEEVASSFISSLSAAVEVADPDKVAEGTSTRKIHIEKDGDMNIYIILDASESVGIEAFEKAKDCIVSLIERVSTYDITPRYTIITYATETKTLVDLEDDAANDASKVIEKLQEFDYSEHEGKSGTNTRLAIEAVYNMMSLHSQRNAEKFKDIRHVIILMTDGKSNMGGDPKISMLRIHDFLRITEERKDYLDVYVFGLSEDVSDEEINGLASKKTNEVHVFKLRDIIDLQKTFDSMIDESSAMNMCGMAKEYDDAPSEEKNPWIVSISIIREGGVEKCKGAVLTPHFILTAAHCFNIDDQAHQIKVETNDRKRYKVINVISHPNYNVNAKKPKIAEFYDYDIALVEIGDMNKKPGGKEEKIEFSSKVRPICIPCTEGTTRALRKKVAQTTCDEHEATLLKWGLVEAMFITQEDNQLTRKDVTIKTGDQKPVCNRDALKAPLYADVKDVNEVVTDRFLCTGGTEPHVNAFTCKGDSGGPLVINHRQRYIQVGVISWGVTNLCLNNIRQPFAKAESRDFHTNLFKVLPWLESKLKEDGLGFLPLP
ncbi:complement factor B-like [Pleurodeles waltl]|uniref:complement factor B-like n=1 Tax=Pleurodeles waltl TaxID=8319 RepID=UPI003709475D